MELAYQRWGAPAANSPAKTRILLLHGMGGTGSLWRPIAAQLEDSYDVLAPDQRGHGGSLIPAAPGGRIQPGYSPVDYASDVAETLLSTGFHPCYVVGHSMGVRTACALAHLKPGLVRGLVLIDLGMEGLAGGGLGETLGSFIRSLPERFESREQARAYMNAHCPDASIAQYLMAVSVAGPAEAGGGIRFPFDHAALVKTIEAARGTSLSAWVEAAAARGIPVLALRGARSQVWSAADFQADRNRFTAGLAVVFEEIEGAGHGLPFEKRAEFVARLTRFVSLSGSG
jgi:pimeloyl-ACP methyl ester carboxylesterase